MNSHIKKIWFLSFMLCFSLLSNVVWAAENSSSTNLQNYISFINSYNNSHQGSAHWNDKKTESTLQKAVNRGDYSVGVTSKTCCGSNGQQLRGTDMHVRKNGCTSNTFGGSRQCHGFSKYFCYVMYGSYPKVSLTESPSTKKSNNWHIYYKGENYPGLQQGDLIVFGGGHSGVVNYVSGDTIHYVDCNKSTNNDGACKIYTDSTKSESEFKRNYNSNSKYFICRYNGASSGSSQPCTNHVKGQYQWPEDAHPHYQYYTCANCGDLFTDGSTTTMSNCSQCNGEAQKQEETTVTLTYSEIGYVNLPGNNLVINSKPAKGNKIISVPHGEQLTIYPDKAVGNWAFVEYNGVQGYSYKSYISKTPTVTVCTNHVKGEFQWFEAAHPHYNYYKCANCGELFTDGTTAYHSTCTECNPPVVTQPEPQPEPQPAPAPEPQPVPQPAPLNTPQVSLGSSSIKEGDSLYVSWTSAGEGDIEYIINWSGTGGVGSSLNIHNTYDTIDGRYFGTAGDYKLKVSAYRDNEKVESGYVYFTVQSRENVRYGIVTGTEGKNLAINDGPASSANGSNKIGRIPPGGQVKVYPDRTSGNWYWVEYNGIQGYAYKKYITLQ